MKERIDLKTIVVVSVAVLAVWLFAVLAVIAMDTVVVMMGGG
jgi:membrane protein involved in colicin uptake